MLLALLGYLSEHFRREILAFKAVEPVLNFVQNLNAAFNSVVVKNKLVGRGYLFGFPIVAFYGSVGGNPHQGKHLFELHQQVDNTDGFSCSLFAAYHNQTAVRKGIGGAFEHISYKAVGKVPEQPLYFAPAVVC